MRQLLENSSFFGDLLKLCWSIWTKVWLREGDLTETDNPRRNLVCRYRWLRGRD